MQVLEKQADLLTNFEVLQFLQESKKNRGKLVNAKKSHTVRTIEAMVVRYLENSPISGQTDDSMAKLIRLLQDLNLNAKERFQLLNHLPKSKVEMYLIIEDCDSRFTPEDIDKLMESIEVVSSSGIAEGSTSSTMTDTVS